MFPACKRLPNCPQGIPRLEHLQVPIYSQKRLNWISKGFSAYAPKLWRVDQEVWLRHMGLFVLKLAIQSQEIPKARSPGTTNSNMVGDLTVWTSETFLLSNFRARRTRVGHVCSNDFSIWETNNNSTCQTFTFVAICNLIYSHVSMCVNSMAYFYYQLEVCVPSKEVNPAADRSVFTPAFWAAAPYFLSQIPRMHSIPVL